MAKSARKPARKPAPKPAPKPARKPAPKPAPKPARKPTPRPAPKPVVKGGVTFSASGKMTSAGGLKAPSAPKPPARNPTGVGTAPKGVSSTPPPGTAYVSRPTSTSDSHNSGLAPGVAVAYDASGKPIGFVQSAINQGVAVTYVDGKPTGFQYAAPDGRLLGSMDADGDGFVDPRPSADAAPAAAPSDGGAPAAPAAPDYGPAPDPRDSEYFTGVARLQAQNAADRASIEQTGVYDQTDTDQALARYRRDNQEANFAAGYGANKQGLLYSGELGKRRGLIDRSTLEQSTAASSDLGRRSAARTAALTGMGTIIADPTSPTGFTGTGGAGLSLQDLINGAVARRRAQNTQTEVPV